jgi:FkbM family methyltransferase
MRGLVPVARFATWAVLKKGLLDSTKRPGAFLVIHALHLRQLFIEREVDCVFDVGANRGQFRDFLRSKVGFTGTIISFEPVAHSALQDSRRAADPTWHVMKMALGTERGRLQLNILRSDLLNSFHPVLPDHLSAVPANLSAGLEAVDTQWVCVQALDNIYAELRDSWKFKHPYLKLDTQGFDLCVLTGATATLADFVALQSELSMIPIYQDMPNWREVTDYLTRQGFHLSGLYPVVFTDDGRVIEADGVFVRGP